MAKDTKIAPVSSAFRDKIKAACATIKSGTDALISLLRTARKAGEARASVRSLLLKGGGLSKSLTAEILSVVFGDKHADSYSSLAAFRKARDGRKTVRASKAVSGNDRGVSLVETLTADAKAAAAGDEEITALPPEGDARETAIAAKVASDVPGRIVATIEGLLLQAVLDGFLSVDELPATASEIVESVTDRIASMHAEADETGETDEDEEMAEAV